MSRTVENERARISLGTPKPAPKPEPDPVEHYCDASAGLIAWELGVEVQSLCGQAWFFLDKDPDECTAIETAADFREGECLLCARVHLARWGQF